jgi:hypothetical protein
MRCQDLIDILKSGAVQDFGDRVDGDGNLGCGVAGEPKFGASEYRLGKADHVGYKAKARVGLGARNVRGGKVVRWVSQGLFPGPLRTYYDRALLGGSGVGCHDLCNLNHSSCSRLMLQRKSTRCQRIATEDYLAFIKMVRKC